MRMCARHTYVLPPPMLLLLLHSTIHLWQIVNHPDAILPNWQKSSSEDEKAKGTKDNGKKGEREDIIKVLEAHNAPKGYKDVIDQESLTKGVHANAENTWPKTVEEAEARAKATAVEAAA